MGFSRTVQPGEMPDANVLTHAMVGIGMNFSGKGDHSANIEDTLLFASELGMEHDDLRVLSVLVTWFGVHASWVNADRLIRIVRGHSLIRVRALWSALATWQNRDRRFARLVFNNDSTPIELLRVGNDFQIKRRGEDERFKGTTLIVPAGVLRERASDVLTPTMLCQRHNAYRFRVVMGPGYRADMWAALDQDSSLNVADLARKTYGSFATAWQVRRDYFMVNNDVENNLELFIP